jgi:Zn-dependent peptidase ImmA (M78 family)
MVMSLYNLNKAREGEISDLASWYADTFCPSPQAVLPQLIAEKLGITYSLGDYKGKFDGLIENNRGFFHIYLHCKDTDNLYSPRLRFTFSHELGHYILDDHRNTLLLPGTPAHGSVTTLDSSIETEREADLFAACLLLPEDRIKRDLFKRKFNFALVDELSRKYNVSLTATLLRFITLGNHPLMMVCSQAGKLKWLRYSNDFPFQRIHTGPGNEIPAATCAGEYFEDGTKYLHKSEKVFAEDWFVLWKAGDQRRQLFEHCIYQESQQQVISVLWEA